MRKFSMPYIVIYVFMALICSCMSLRLVENTESIRNHPNQTIFIEFYSKSYNDEEMRGLAHKKLKKNIEKLQDTINSGAPIKHINVIDTLGNSLL